MELKQLLLWLALDLVHAHFYTEPEYFLVLGNTSTWNEARTTCHELGGHLLSIRAASDWEVWINVLNTTRQSYIRAESGTYWFGLHAPDVTDVERLTWDDCSDVMFSSPAFYLDEATGYQCVSMWVHVEVFNDVFRDVWVKGQMCSLPAQPICEFSVRGSGCMATCDEVLAPSTATECKTACEGASCTAQFLSQLGLCHITPDMYVHAELFSLCYFPSVDYVPTCQDSLAIPVSTVDSNPRVTDTKCISSDTTTDVTPTTVGMTSELAPTIVISDVTMTTKVNTAADTTTPEVGNKTCTCLCQQLWTFLALPPPEEENLTVEEKVEQIVQALTIERKNTTVAQRKKISVMDTRVSSMGIGAIAGGVIFSVFGIIVLIDLSKIRHELRYLLQFVVARFRGYMINHVHPIKDLAGASNEPSVSIAIGGPLKLKPKLQKQKTKRSVITNKPDINTHNNQAKTVNGKKESPDKSKSLGKRPASKSTEHQEMELEDVEDPTDVSSETSVNKNSSPHDAGAPRQLSVGTLHTGDENMEYYINSQIGSILKTPGFTKGLQPAYKSTGILLPSPGQVKRVSVPKEDELQAIDRNRHPNTSPKLQRPGWKYWK
ncbi:uncharacterized protein LOC128210288 isoform X1 [Mya arenaria]|uniref:uncharacterized protein LOC128210288 isoform X1 n=2 Tax=Mya arenaria TaxID=6604 RepID=UPI0022E3AC28|nr:uncharacterized protein LOC128210288 isoform X1 [Mya arenaria]